jgi:hypothetical protein
MAITCPHSPYPSWEVRWIEKILEINSSTFAALSQLLRQ